MFFDKNGKTVNGVIPFDESCARYQAAREHFLSSNVTDEVTKSADTTRNWLLENKGRGTPDGHLVSEGWWNASKTDCPFRLKTRELKLLNGTYEHGMIKLLNLLNENNVMRMNKKSWDMALSADTITIWNELFTYDIVPEVSSWVNAEDLKQLFGNGERKMSTIRTHLVWLAELGICEVRYNEGYSAKIGTLGRIFYKSVFFPVTNHMNAK